MAGKGDKPRPVDPEVYGRNWEVIFGGVKDSTVGKCGGSGGLNELSVISAPQKQVQIPKELKNTPTTPTIYK